MVTEPTHRDEGVPDLVLTDIPDVIVVWVDSSVGTSDLSAIFIDIVLKQSIPYLVCRQEVSGSWLEEMLWVSTGMESLGLIARYLR